MSIRVGINGFGRIGRAFVRAALDNTDINIVAANDLAPFKTSGHLLKYDTGFGRFPGDIYVSEALNTIAIDDGRFDIRMFNEGDPAKIPWESERVDVVLESTGRFRNAAEVETHNADKVIVSAPTKGEDITIVMGVNDHLYDDAKHRVISNASCTTNCVAPMAKVLDGYFGIVKGMMTTIHAYTNDQMILDSPHKDLRRARAAAQSIIPTSTGAARALALVLPSLEGKIDGLAMRVPVIDGSATDLVVEVEDDDLTVDEINSVFKENASPYLQYCVDPIVSSDVIGSDASCIFDSQLTMVNGNLVKVIGWYDNEFGYASRLVDLIEMVGRT
jgi:glyceraldehyde 3-phosphate dehydrogenase